MSTRVYNTCEVLSWQPKIFYICKPYFFFGFYNPLSIPSLVVFIFFFFFFLQTPRKFYCVTYTFHIWQTYEFFHIYEHL